MAERKDRMAFADTLNQILSALRGEGSGHPIYGQQDPGFMAHGGFAAGQAQTPQRLPMQPDGPMNDRNLPPMGLDGPMNDQNLPQWGQHRGTPMQGMHRDEMGMNRMMEALTNPYREGQNANIQDDTRARAMAWLRAQQGG